jgi:hypothetical protein
MYAKTPWEMLLEASIAAVIKAMLTGRVSSETSFVIKAMLTGRVSSETSFVSKQPKQEPKLVSALSETTETNVSKQNEKQPKQIEFRFVSDRSEKKLFVSRTPYLQGTGTHWKVPRSVALGLLWTMLKE